MFSLSTSNTVTQNESSNGAITSEVCREQKTQRVVAKKLYKQPNCGSCEMKMEGYF